MSIAENNLQVLQGTQSAHVALVNFDREQIDTIKRTVAKGVTDAELSMFLTICGRYQLDPFLKEIWCYKRQKKGPDGRYVDDPNAPAIIMTSRDGYLKVAQRDPDFDGLKSFVVREGDVFEIDAETDKVIHKFGAKRGKILGAWATVYHRKRRPVTVYVEFDEYNAKSNTWNGYPSAMIQKVAESFGLKRQFGINGLVTQEEMDSQAISEPINITPTSASKPSESRDERLKALNELNKYATSVGVTGDDLRTIGKRVTGQASPAKWTAQQIDDVRKEIASYNSAIPEVIDIQVSEPSAPNGFDLPDDEDLPF